MTDPRTTTYQPTKLCPAPSRKKARPDLMEDKWMDGWMDGWIDGWVDGKRGRKGGDDDGVVVTAAAAAAASDVKLSCWTPLLC